MSGKYRFETSAIHAGQEPDPGTGSRGVPVYRTSSFVFKNTEHGANLFALKEFGNIYSRIMNPTHEVLENRISTLEGGVGAVALSSGTSAVYYSLINIMKTGDEFVTANNLYGGTYTMFDSILPQLGITPRFVHHDNYDEYEKAINERTRAIYIETIGNPSLGFTDIEKVASIAKRYNLPLVVDSTFTTPYLLRPIEYGADIVVHSLTKWIGGHGSAIGGLVVDAGKFDWSDTKFSLYNEPDTGYHGLRFGRDLGELNTRAYILRLRLVPLRNLGACLSPDNAWIFLQGVESLHLRMERHCQNAMAIAEFLKGHRHVSWVRYPGLKSDPAYECASRYLTKGYGGMVVFGIKGGMESAVRFIDSIQLFSHVANVGDAKSLVLHPASTSHSQLDEAAQRDSGLTPELVRLSIGLEHVDDLKEALNDALHKARA